MIDAATPPAAEAHGTTRPPHTDHLPERFGLFTIILLGEAMTAVMRGMRQHEDWPPAAALSVLTGFPLVFGVWWIYFHAVGAAAPRSLHSRRLLLRATSVAATSLVGSGFSRNAIAGAPAEAGAPSRAL